jgi:hypothetical protein
MERANKSKYIRVNSPGVNSEVVIPGKLTQRANLAHQMGLQSFSGARDIRQALGYLDSITYNDYLARYQRQDIAKAIIDRPVRATWGGSLEIEESNDDEITALESAWVDLEKDLKLKSIFSRVDKLAGIGTYGVLLLGLDDVKSQEQFATPATIGSELVYVKPFGEINAKITTYETDTSNPRYGLPLIYTVTMADTTQNTSTTINVHHSRIIHVVDDILESEISSAPRLEVVFDRLMDLEKIIGGDAEMFWRGARPGFNAKIEKDYQMGVTEKDALLDTIDEYEHNLRRILLLNGVDITALAQQIADPTNHFNIQIQCLSAVTGIPQRVLMGSERGQLASGQDADEWDTYVQNRRDEHAGPHIVQPFIDRCIELKVLPKPTTEEGWKIKWSDLFASSEAQRVAIGVQRAAALASYVGNPAIEAVVPPKAFMEFFLGFDGDQIDLINEMVESEVVEEETSIEEMPVEPLQEDKTKPLTHGGEGSGNFGHEGRPGEIGGSGEGGDVEEINGDEIFKSYKEWKKEYGTLNSSSSSDYFYVPMKDNSITEIRVSNHSVRKPVGYKLPSSDLEKLNNHINIVFEDKQYVSKKGIYEKDAHNVYITKKVPPKELRTYLIKRLNKFGGISENIDFTPQISYRSTLKWDKINHQPVKEKIETPKNNLKFLNPNLD